MRTNKHVIIFSAILLLFLTSYSFLLLKFFPILVHHTFYYCREMAKTIALTLPENIGSVIFGLLLVTILYTILKVGATLLQVALFHRSLNKPIAINRRLSVLIKKTKLTGKVTLLSQKKPFAYCFGLHSPQIFLTTGLLSLMNQKEVELILRHEKYHLEHHDNFILLLARLVESLFPFFPLLTDFIRIYKIDRELLADQAAIQSKADVNVLSSILRKLLKYEPDMMPLFAPAIADSETLETRIRSLLSLNVQYRRFQKKNVLYSFIFLITLGLLIGTPVNAVELHESGLDAMIVCNENVSCESLCRDSRAHASQIETSTSVFKNFSPQ